jgi:hypothetical protein
MTADQNNVEPVPKGKAKQRNLPTKKEKQDISIMEVRVLPLHLRV